MRLFPRVRRRSAASAAGPDLPRRYRSFRRLLGLNNECLELLASLQEDLLFVSPASGCLDETLKGLFERTRGIVEALEDLSGSGQARLSEILASLAAEIDRYLDSLRHAPTARLLAALPEIGVSDEMEVGGKAAALAEIRNRAALPVPDGAAVTTEAYRQFCETVLWREIRDTLRDLEPGAGPALPAASRRLTALVEELPLPPAVEGVIVACARELAGGSYRLAVRSSAPGEAGPHGYAGQFLSVLDVSPEQVPAAWRRVVASRFSEHALSYRLSNGIAEIESPLAVLLMRMVPAAVSGILYTRNPSEPRQKELWITSTPGLGAAVASGDATGDFLIVSHRHPHRVLASQRRPGSSEEAAAALLGEAQITELAAAALAIEKHFRAPQDIEWAFDASGQLWILQARRLSLTGTARRRLFSRPRIPPLAEGGRTVCPGRASGRVWIAGATQTWRDAPRGCLLVLDKATPGIAAVLPRVDGVVAEWGNVTGHAAALLREFQVPSVFLMPGVTRVLRPGQEVSLDARERKIYAGTLWLPRLDSVAAPVPSVADRAGPIRRRVLNLNLLHPTSGGFHPRACKSVHDVLRYCHEKAVEAMFSTYDTLSQTGSAQCRRLKSPLPINVLVLDLGGGIRETAPRSGGITVEHIRCRPFEAIWKGFTHPDVEWTRDMPISFADITSVLAGSLSTDNYLTRALGEQSYLMVAPEYFNLNARLAYHFTLIDACLSDQPSNNYVSFRFAGGGASRDRRSLRAYFIDACLTHYGFHVDRRGDLVNAWLKSIDPGDLAGRLDILGRLTATTCQLDMYMTSREAMEWYIRQFLAGNYGFHTTED